MATAVTSTGPADAPRKHLLPAVKMWEGSSRSHNLSTRYSNGYLPHFAAVIFGPGYGDIPNESNSLGVMSQTTRLPEPSSARTNTRETRHSSRPYSSRTNTSGVLYSATFLGRCRRLQDYPHQQCSTQDNGDS
ncbi:hypothetical protein Bbelb_027730 [Branchiostoma belcheri]|nr:hypothetical protein Bbelb_027730 [Branchiostoma belcheri]